MVNFVDVDEKNDICVLVQEKITFLFASDSPPIYFNDCYYDYYHFRASGRRWQSYKSAPVSYIIMVPDEGYQFQQYLSDFPPKLVAFA